MASANGVIPSADCNVVDTPVETKAKPIQLCMFKEPLSAVETLERTVSYARNPEQYLKDNLGQSTFESKKAILSLPEEVNLDMYGTGTHKYSFQTHIAKLLSKKEGLFFITGVQAQLAALKIHSQRSGRGKIAWHVSCHLESAEEAAYKHLYNLDRVLLGSDPKTLPTVDEIKYVLDVAEQDRPAAVLLEIPNRVVGCKTYTYAELQEISSACKAANVALHMDGARLWEIEPYYAATASVSFAELGALFDSVYVSFYKGLRGITGAMLVHNDASFISEAKAWQRRAGGNAFTLGCEVIDCERGFNQNIGTFARKRDKMIRVVDGITSATKGLKNSNGEPIVSFVPERATCCQILTYFSGYTESELTAARDRVEEKTSVRVFERMRPKQSLDEKLAADRAADVASKDADSKGKKVEVEEKRVDKTHFMEWMLMSVTEKIGDHVFVDAYVALCTELVGKDK